MMMMMIMCATAHAGWVHDRVQHRGGFKVGFLSVLGSVRAFAGVPDCRRTTISINRCRAEWVERVVERTASHVYPRHKKEPHNIAEHTLPSARSARAASASHRVSERPWRLAASVAHSPPHFTDNTRLPPASAIPSTPTYARTACQLGAVALRDRHLQPSSPVLPSK